MRLLTRKIYRAYPELDKFEDDVCKRYIKRAKRLQNTWKLWLFQLLALLISIVLWGIASSLIELILFFGEATRRDQLVYIMLNPIHLVFKIIQMSGYIFVPAICCLRVRDRWLHRCIRKQLTGVQCGACGYSLLGLSISDENNTPSVHCPECGLQTVLKDMGLTQADINPNLASS
ncbi:MAG: hypothetical protein JJ974_12155 [Phycisphaerales bacterium]|nr:hypothetical protein [Phycisphaerales bacterium]